MSTRKPVLSYCRPRFGMTLQFALLWMTATNFVPRAEARGLHLSWTTRRARAISVAALAALAVSIPVVAQPPPGAPPRDRSGRSVLPVIGTASISGIVIDAATGLPLARAVVSVYCPTCGPGAVRSIATDTDTQGRYELVGLPDGLYTVTAWTRAHQSQQFGSLAGRPGSGRRVPVGNGERVRGIDIAMTRGAVLTGRVTDPDGEPVPNVAVMVYSTTRSLQAGRRYMVHRQSPTDDLGQFRFSNMPPGTYFVAADPQLSRPLADSGLPDGWWVKDVRVNGQDAVLGFDFGVGHHFTGLEIVVSDRPPTLGGRVRTPTGEPAVDVVVAIPEDIATFDSFFIAGLGGTTRTDQHGAYRFTGIRAGTYHVIAQETQYLPATFFDDLDALRDLAARATRVTMSESSEEQVELTVAVP